MSTKTLHLAHDGIDEALWAAYRREDKAAVMHQLFRRFPQIAIKAGPTHGVTVNRVQSPFLKIRALGGQE